MTARHADDCDYHCDQYPHECTCGVSNPKEPDTMSNETQPAITKEVEFEETSFKQVLPLVQITDDMLTDAPFPDAALPDPLPNTEMPAPFPTDEANWPAGIAEELAEANAKIAAIEARTKPEPAPEREKVWNIHLQAWV